VDAHDATHTHTDTTHTDTTHTAPTHATAGPVQPVLVRAGQAEVLTGDPTSPITLLADSDVTGGAITTNRSLLRDGAFGAPPHLHTSATELFVVLGGRLQVLVGEEVEVLEVGDVLIVPPGTHHAFAPAAGSDADFLVVFSPGMDRFGYYRLLDRVARGEADPSEIGASQDRYDNHYVTSPAWQAARGR
jgi:mannose-6-phosphate isomerase-like protein (cupin superfamily)